MIRIITNLVFGAALLCLLPVASLQLFRCIVTFSDFVDWRPFALGILPGMVLGEVTIRWIPQLHVLEHELTHAFVGLWFGAIPVDIEQRDQPDRGHGEQGAGDDERDFSMTRLEHGSFFQ